MFLFFIFVDFVVKVDLNLTLSLKRDTLNPTWNEQLTFEVKDSDKCPYFIHVDLYDWDSIGKNDFIGGLMLPLNDFTGTHNRRTFRAPIGLGLRSPNLCFFTDILLAMFCQF
jgi:Ca2+-dependent lipid-binding protein